MYRLVVPIQMIRGQMQLQTDAEGCSGKDCCLVDCYAPSRFACVGRSYLC